MHIEEITGVLPIDAFLALRGHALPFIFAGNPALKQRYSFVSAAPVKVIRTEGGVTSIGGKAALCTDPFEAVSKALEGYGNAAPRFPFNSGIAGYFAYDLKDLIEPGLRPRKRPGIDGVPDCVAGLYDPVFVYDHEEQSGYIVSASGDKARIELFRDALKDKKVRQAGEAFATGGFSSDTAKEEYIASVSKAKGYIAEGDIYQINLSQRLSIPFKGDPFGVYLKLINDFPAPYSSFFDFGPFQVISNSPERLLKVQDGFVETSPIKGTQRRGATVEEDARLIRELKASAKERAEHVMIVDLERSDLGRIAQPGSVEVASFETIETYPHLHHMISTVRGRLKPGVNAPAALRAVFPGGSITGAPKIRAMEIIDELEKASRSIYTGGIGWLDAGGGADISMAIRTAVCKDGTLYLSVGGGIVADSVEEDEYNETILKARDFLGVLGAGKGV